MVLNTGQKYDLDNLEFDDWVGPNGEVSDDEVMGYSCWHYFTDDGVFKGPDQYGIQPIVSLTPIKEL